MGCWPTIDNTALAYVLVLTPPLGLAVVASMYSTLCVVGLQRNLIGIKEILSISQDKVTPSQYVRLLCLTGIQALFQISTHLYVIIASATKGHVEPWLSWKKTHYSVSWVFISFDAYRMTCVERTDFERIDVKQERDSEFIDLERTRWTLVISGLLFFALFGFAGEAIRNYTKYAKRLLVRKAASTPMSRDLSSVGFHGSGKSLVFDDEVSTMSRTEMAKEQGQQRHSMDTESVFTERTGSTTLAWSVEKRQSTTHGDTNNDEESIIESEAHASTVDSISLYSQPSLRYPRSPVLPPASLDPPGTLLDSQEDGNRHDFIRPMSSLLENQYHYPQGPFQRTPPRQTIPISVAPTPEGSFLDLRASLGPAV